MTVEELRIELSKYPGDWEVRFEDSYCGAVEIVSVVPYGEPTDNYPYVSLE